MLISSRFSIIGFHLLLLTHIAHTFVLLTANMEDVKKLARKFVSDSLADKIAEFIAKATQNMAGDVSEDNDMMAEDSHQVSEENNKYNVERHGFESAPQDNIKSKEDINEKEDLRDSRSISNEQKEGPVFDFGDLKGKPDKPDVPVRLEGPSRYIKEESETVQQYAYTLESQDKKPNSRLSDEDEKYNKEKNPNKYLDDSFVSSTQTTTFAPENYSEGNKRARKKVKGRPYRLLSHLNSIEDNEVSEVNTMTDTINSTVDEFSENELFSQKRSMDTQLTTRKAVYEFDQYDNKNYPKSEFIATSGPVVLRKMPNDKVAGEKWWEKEMPEEGRRKSWF